VRLGAPFQHPSVHQDFPFRGCLTVRIHSAATRSHAPRTPFSESWHFIVAQERISSFLNLECRTAASPPVSNLVLSLASGASPNCHGCLNLRGEVFSFPA
jgi:hypothetical protein